MKGILVLLGALALAAIGIVVWVIVDEATEPASGIVTSKQYHPAWTSTHCNLVGKVLVCTPIHHPECYEVRYHNDGAYGDACVSRSDYEIYQLGDLYPVVAR